MKTRVSKIFVIISTIVLAMVLSIGSVVAASPLPEQSIQKDAVDSSMLIWAEEPSVQLNLGVNFTAKMAGVITKVKIYAKANESGEHIVAIWNADNRQMVAGPYTWNVTAPGADQWIEFTLPESFRVAVGGRYAVTVSNSPEFMFYPCYEGFYASPITSVAFGVDINSGCFGVGKEAYPQNPGINGRSFLRDVVFVPDGEYNPDASADNTGKEISIHGNISSDNVLFAGESVPLMLGTAFSTKKDGQITAIKAYTSTGAAGTVTACIWDADNNALVAGPYTWTLGSNILGWQTFDLPEAVDIVKDTKYVVAVSTYGSNNEFPLVEKYFSEGNDGENFVTYQNGGLFTTDLNVLPGVQSARSFLRDITFVPKDSVTPPPTGDNSIVVIGLCMAVVAAGAIVLLRSKKKSA